MDYDDVLAASLSDSPYYYPWSVELSEEETTDENTEDSEDNGSENDSSIDVNSTDDSSTDGDSDMESLDSSFGQTESDSTSRQE